MVIRVAIDLKLFEIIAKKPSTLDELAKETGADRRLLKRFMRLLTGIGFLQQREVDKWEATPLTHAATAPPLRAWLIAHFDKRVDISAQFPEWLKKHKYQTTWLEDDNIAKQVFGTDCWTYLEENKELGQIFDQAMSIQESFPPETRPPYPFADERGEIKTDADAVTLVDVGGGFGQAIKAMRQKYPDVKGRFVLQDLPRSIEKVDQAQAKQDGFEATAHDFFTPQPVKGAKYYHYRRVFHDWNDENSLKILKALRPALEPGYSKLLIHDFVMPDVNPGPLESLVDLIMMTTCDGCERSESEWRELLSKGGFKIDRILRADTGTVSVIEASLA